MALNNRFQGSDRRAGVASNKIDVTQIAHVELGHCFDNGEPAFDAASPVQAWCAVIVLVAFAGVAGERGRLIDAGGSQGRAWEADAAVGICVGREKAA